MNFEELRRRVERSEQLVDGRIRQTGEARTRLWREWRLAWTPTRIVVAGLLAGFVIGRAEPQRALQRLGKLGGPRSIQLIGSIAGLLSSLQATIAAATAKQAAAAADDTPDAQEPAQTQADAGSHAGDREDADAATGPAATATAEPEAVPPRDRRRPDPTWDAQPSPAEAATEVSER